MHTRTVRQSVVASLIALLLTQGCLSLRRPMKRFATQEEAGSVQVAIQSIARFDDVYIDALQPHFDVTSKDALDAIAQTQVSEVQRLRALVAELTLSGAKKEGTQERVLDKGEVTKDTVSEKRTSPAIDTTAGPGAVGFTLSPFSVDGQAIQLDPALQRRAAAAYLQEIALLNRYVQDAAVSRGTYPMVVRLLVTVTPSARREPYDTYTTVSLFTTGDKDYSETIRELRLAEIVNIGYEDVAESTKQRFKFQSASATAARLWFQQAKTTGGCTQSVEIIPLFVTDNLESSLNSASNQRIINTSARGTGFWANIAAAVGLRTQADDRDRSIAHGLNSLYTISKLSGNTIEARFGAIAANNDYEMISRTFNVTLLALVPTAARDYESKTTGSDAADDVLRTMIPCKRLEFVADSFFRDALKGTQVPDSFASLKRRRFQSMNRSWQFRNATVATVHLDHLLALAQMDRHDDFDRYVSDSANAPGLAMRSGPFDATLTNTLWHDLVSFGRASGRSYGTFEIPLSRPTTFFRDRTATLFDDGKETRLVLGGAQNVSADGLRAVVEVIGPDSKSASFESSSVSMSSDERRATFKFASMSKTLGGAPSNIRSVEVTKSPGRRDWDDQKTFVWSHPVTYVADGTRPDAPTATVTMNLSSDVIRMKEGLGDVSIGFTAEDSAAPPTVIVDVAGGFIDAVTPPATMPNGRLEILGHGTYKLSLKNLSEDRKVLIRALQKDGKKTIPIGEKTLEVRTK